MASKSDLKFITTLSFAQEIAKALFKSYEDEVKCNLIKKRSLELLNVSGQHLQRYALEIKASKKDIKKVAIVVGKMMKGGLEEAKSFQVYLSMLIGLLSEREQELISHNGNKKRIAAMVEIQESTEKCWTYFSSRTRKDEFDSIGLDLLNVFNSEFA